MSEALELAADVAGVERSPRLLPRPVATAGAFVVERGFKLARRHPPICREMVRTLLHGHRYDGSRAERELGLRYTGPARDAAPDGRVGASRRPAPGLVSDAGCGTKVGTLFRSRSGRARVSQ